MNYFWVEAPWFMVPHCLSSPPLPTLSDDQVQAVVAIKVSSKVGTEHYNKLE